MKRRSKFKGRKGRMARKRRREPSIKKRMLDMRRMDMFQWNLKNILDGLPDEEYRGPIFANVCSKSSNLGIDKAKDYVHSKREEGNIGTDIADEILVLLDRYSRNR